MEAMAGTQLSYVMGLVMKCFELLICCHWSEGGQYQIFICVGYRYTPNISERYEDLNTNSQQKILCS